MAETSNISWTDATFNGWIGCSEISPGCDHCYAARDNERRGWVPGWGAGVPRHRTSADYWKQPLRWDRKARESGRPLRVFCASLADVFDNEVPDEWRADLFALIRTTPNLRWMLLTKRIGNAARMLPSDWPGAFPNAGLMATVINQQEWDRDVPKLMAIPAWWRGVSCEPLLGPINIGPWRPNWIIVGGESGPQARPMSHLWVRELRDQSAGAEVPFLFKQWGEWAWTHPRPSGEPGRFAFGDFEHDRSAFIQVDEYPRQFTKFGARVVMQRIGRRKAGWLLDGVEHKNFPAALAA